VARRQGETDRNVASLAATARILAIETSGRDASVAVLEATGGGARSLAQDILSGSERTATMLAPRLDKLLAGVGWPARSIEVIAVAVGPGSFTGLRIGVTTAKTLAYAVGAEVIGVSTLAAIAEQAPPAAAPLWVVMDAQRQELFAAKFDGQPRLSIATRIVAQSEWLASLEPGDFVTGPGLRRVLSALPIGVTVVHESLWQPLAATVGQIGWRDFQSGRREDVWTLVPQYFRRSAADEKATTKRNG
jgi:tRNA threonylcarbamoyladenosine biosynthesis protein TsaB